MRATPPPEPDEASLHGAALRHLARYATTVAGLTRILDRRVSGWARAADPPPEPAAQQAARAAVREVVARLARAGVLDDAAFAEGRAVSLARAGRSSRAIAAHLAARGVDRALVDAALPSDPEHDLAAAVAATRRRRIGPFRQTASDEELTPEARRRELAMLARGGFSEALARRALALPRDEADALLRRLRGLAPLP